MTDPIADVMKSMIQQEKESNPRPLELIRCPKCRKMNTWDNTRKLLDENGKFIAYHCSKCVTEGYRL